MTLPLFDDDTDVPVYLTCPSCARTWHAASLVPGAWWMKGISPQVIAGQVWCRCGQAPPMTVATGMEREA